MGGFCSVSEEAHTSMCSQEADDVRLDIGEKGKVNVLSWRSDSLQSREAGT
jgi:hypothetical protein